VFRVRPQIARTAAKTTNPTALKKTITPTFEPESTAHEGYAPGSLFGI
jgi:hypothetical protein